MAEERPTKPAAGGTRTYDDEEQAAFAWDDEADWLARGTSVGRFVVLGRVGEGGMGVVYAAYDPDLDRKVALKFLHARRGDSAGSRHEERLLREAKAMAKLSHPNVVTAFDVGTFEDRVFVAMEFIEGLTLRDWLVAQPRDWGEIWQVFRSAAEGLSAAHAAGIVHRDFKPDNVIVDGDGQARVTDFGLARGLEDVTGPANADEHGSPVHAALTRTGAIVGTPRYMAPEQHRVEPTDARTDQFSFCVALYEAVYGAPPFGGESAAAITERVLAGEVSPPPGDAAVPRWRRQALLRGLRPSPDERYPDMESLVRALDRNPATTRRRAAAGVAMAAAVGTLAALAFGGGDRHAGPACRADPGQLAGVWDDDVRARTRAAFLAADSPGAAQAFERFSGALDEYAAALLDMQVEACRATRIRGAQSELLLDRRMQCLERRRTELAALASAFSADVDAKTVGRAAVAADSLTAIAACADADNLLAVVPLPDDAATRQRVAGIRTQLAESIALYSAGRYERGRALVEALVTEATDIDYPPLDAEVQFELGKHRGAAGDVAAADEAFRRAARSAARGHAWIVEADAWISLVDVAGSMRGKLDEALLLADVARAAIDRAGASEAQLGRLRNNVGVAYYVARDVDKAIEEFVAVVDLYTRALGPDSPRLGNALTNLGAALGADARYEESLPHLRRGLDIRTRALGDAHPSVSYSLNGLATTLAGLGKFNEAREYGRKCLDLRIRTLGPDHVDTGWSMIILAETTSMLGHHAEARRLIDEALAIHKDAGNASHPLLSVGYLARGEILLRAGDLDAAEPYLIEAIAFAEGLDSPDHWVIGTALAARGELALARGDRRSAIAHCEAGHRTLTAAEADPYELTRPFTCIGEAHLAAAETTLAAAALERATSVAGFDQNLPSMVGRAYFARARAVLPTAPAQARTFADQAHAAFARSEADVASKRQALEAWARDHDIPLAE